MRTGVVIHGPEAIDSGLAPTVIERLRMLGDVKATIGGATGVAAVIDAGLEGAIDISKRERPSDALVRLGRDSDLLVLINEGKSEESAIEFGRQVYSRVEGMLSKPFFQIDKRQVIFWNSAAERFARDFAAIFGKSVVDGTKLERKREEARRRTVSCVKKGEAVWINGKVIGRATEKEIVIVDNGEGGLELMGIDAKVTGLERVGKVDLRNAIIRSGVTRRTSATKRSIKNAGDGKAYLVDHDAENAAFALRGASVVVTIGDDTTANAGSVLARFGVPIVGIIDGDEDAICRDRSFERGSVIFRVRSGEDDIVGKQIREGIFGGKEFKEMGCREDFVGRIQEIARESILSRQDF